MKNKTFIIKTRDKILKELNKGINKGVIDLVYEEVLIELIKKLNVVYTEYGKKQFKKNILKALKESK